MLEPNQIQGFTILTYQKPIEVLESGSRNRRIQLQILPVIRPASRVNFRWFQAPATKLTPVTSNSYGLFDAGDNHIVPPVEALWKQEGGKLCVISRHFTLP